VSRIDFALHGLPVPQGSHRCRNGNVVPDNGPALKAWRKAVGHHARQAMPDGWVGTGPMAVALSFWFPRPLSHYLRGEPRANAPTWKTSRPDIDKLARSVLDALTQARIWQDDSQVVYLSAEKSWDRAGWARIVVRRMYGNQETKGTEPNG
jgi:Holliday junction resolvase RusA-like endonuclease